MLPWWRSWILWMCTQSFILIGWLFFKGKHKNTNVLDIEVEHCPWHLMCNVFIHQLLEFSVFIKTLGSLNLDGHNIRTRFCCYLLFLPMFYDFFVECFYCKIWSRDNWQVALDNDWLIAWLCNCWHVVKHVVNPSNNTFNRKNIIITIFVNEIKCIFEKIFFF
jgi:hypothetical protein